MRIVIKIGTNLVTDQNGAVDKQKIFDLVDDIYKLKKAGHQIVLVTSGAIGSGMGKLGWSSRPANLREKQALAAIGQPLLMDFYQERFTQLGMTIAQILLTRQDFDDRQRYLNARNTLLTLLDLNVIPIINENDTIAVDEINFGDNDTLAALVSSKISADYLVLLTDVDGLYKGEPGKSELIHMIEKITPEIEKCAKKTSGSGKGTGGMQTKICAAKISVASGVKTIIANGTTKGIIERIIKGEDIGTRFIPTGILDSRKRWIAFGTKCKGKIKIDQGAVKAITELNKSLLPSGITAVEGKFKVGDPISVISPDKKEIARGLTYYSSDEVKTIKGKRSSEIKSILQNASYDEVIHKDNLVILK